jgi:ribosomal protein L1
MRKAGKNITKARAAVGEKPYPLQEAVPLLQKVKYAKFDETVEVTMRLGVDPKHADQMVREKGSGYRYWRQGEGSGSGRRRHRGR